MRIEPRANARPPRKIKFVIAVAAVVPDIDDTVIAVNRSKAGGAYAPAVAVAVSAVATVGPDVKHAVIAVGSVPGGKGVTAGEPAVRVVVLACLA